MHDRAMPSIRRILVLLTAAALAACSQSGEKRQSNDSLWQRAGWHYNFEENDDRGAVIYRFGDNSKDYFIALCDRVPTFALEHHGYDPHATSFSIDIDRRSWTLPKYRDEHSNALTIQGAQFANYFADAKYRISYHVGKAWTVEIPPSPLLARLVAECRVRNKVH
jgi:hypothetical protein